MDSFSSGALEEVEVDVPPSSLTTNKHPLLPGSRNPPHQAAQPLRPLSDPTPQHFQPFSSSPAGRPWPVSGLSLGARTTPGAWPGPTQHSASPPVVPGRPRTHRPALRQGFLETLLVASLACRCERPTWNDLLSFERVKDGPKWSEAELKKGSLFLWFS